MSRHRARSAWLRNRVALTVALVVTLLMGSTAAWAFWLPQSAPGSAAATALSVGAGSVPTTQVSSSSIVVTWSASTIGPGSPATGYLIKRYASSGMVLQSITAGCAGTISGLGCVEAAVPAGSWVYTVTPVVGANWVGVEGAPSSPVTSTGGPATNQVWMWITP